MKTLVLSISLALACGSALAATSKQDKEFAMKAAQGGMAEVKMGRLAESNAADAQVKAFGQKMVTDHSSADASLKDAAAKDDIEPVPRIWTSRFRGSSAFLKLF